MTKIERDRFNRPLITPPEGGEPVPYTRASKLAEALDDGFGLTYWKTCMVAKGMASRPDLQDLAIGLDYYEPSGREKKELASVAKEAQEEAGSTKKRNLGSGLHKLSEFADQGEELPAGTRAEVVKDIEAYSLATAGFEVIDVEEFVVNDALRAAGTPDRLVEVKDSRFEPVLEPGEVVIADLKTGKVDYPLPFAIQLAVYANAERVESSESPEREPLHPGLCKAHGVIIHLPPGKARATLYTVDLVKGWEAAQAAAKAEELRKLEKQKNGLIAPLSMTEDALLAAIEGAETTEELVLLWKLTAEDDWTDDVNEAAKSRRAELTKEQE